MERETSHSCTGGLTEVVGVGDELLEGKGGGPAGGGGEDSLPLGKVLGSRVTGSVLEAPERCDGKSNLCLLLAA